MDKIGKRKKRKSLPSLPILDGGDIPGNPPDPPKKDPANATKEFDMEIRDPANKKPLGKIDVD